MNNVNFPGHDADPGIFGTAGWEQYGINCLRWGLRSPTASEHLIEFES